MYGEVIEGEQLPNNRSHKSSSLPFIIFGCFLLLAGFCCLLKQLYEYSIIKEQSPADLFLVQAFKLSEQVKKKNKLDCLEERLTQESLDEQYFNQNLPSESNFDHVKDSEQCLRKIPSSQNLGLEKSTETLLKIVFHEIFKTFKPAQQYYGIEKIKQVKQLPICAIATQKIWNQKVKSSLKNQTHQNFHAIIIGKSRESSNDFQYVNDFQNQRHYYHLKKIIKHYCKDKELVVIVRGALKKNSFEEINNKFQRKKIWVAYEKDFIKSSLMITAFYQQVYYAIESNDISEINKDNLKLPNFQETILGFVELAKNFIIKLQSLDLYLQQKPKDQKLICSTSQILGIYNSSRKKYESLLTLNNTQIKDYFSYNIFKNNLPQHNNITKSQIIRFLEGLQLKNLHQNHSLHQRDWTYYLQKYNFSEVGFEESLCVVVFMENKLKNNEYKKVLDSIQYQDYKNYTIVLIDRSTDSTLEQSKQYIQNNLQKISKKVKFVKTSSRIYLQGICNYQSVLLLMEGNSELVGNNIFKLINKAYSDKQTLIAYTNSYNYDEMTVGSSRIIPESYFRSPSFFRHYPEEFLGNLKTFSIKLILQGEKKQQNILMRLIDHDLRSQITLLELAGRKIKYIPELCYLQHSKAEITDSQKKQFKKKRKKQLQEFRVQNHQIKQ